MRTGIAKGAGFAGIAGATAALAACMVNQPPAQRAAAMDTRQCFHAGQVNGFHAIGRDTVNVHVGASRVYQLEILGTCPDVNWSSRIGVRATGGGSWVCRGFDAELLVPRPGGGFDRCPVTSVRQLSPAEIEAARARRS